MGHELAEDSKYFKEVCFYRIKKHLIPYLTVLIPFIYTEPSISAGSRKNAN